MKKTLLSLAIAALPVSTVFAGENDVTVYGKVNLTALNLDREGSSAGINYNPDATAQLTSNASRLGVKGKVKINDNFQAIYKMEFEVAVDDGDVSDQTFKQRNIYGGLQGGFGTLIGGKHDTPFKLAQGKVDLFNDLVAGDIKNVFTGENRADNIIMYTTPDLGGVSLTVSTLLGEGSEETTSSGSIDEHDGFADAISASLSYESDLFFVTLAIDNEVKSKLELLREVEDDALTLDDIDYSARTDAYRLVGGVNLGPLQINGLYQVAEASNDSSVEFDGYMLSAKYKLNEFTFKAQYAMNEGDSAAGEGADTEITQIALGVDYKLADKTKLFAYYSNLDFDVSAGVVTAGQEAEESVLALGLEHKF